MADTMKGNVVFLIEDDEEQIEDINLTSSTQNAESKELAKPYLNSTERLGKETVKSVSFEENINVKTNDARRQSVSSIPSNLNPTRNATYGIDRDRHHSATDEAPRRFVLNPSSKVSLEVRRNHSGSRHNFKNFLFHHFFPFCNTIRKLMG